MKKLFAAFICITTIINSSWAQAANDIKLPDHVVLVIPTTTLRNIPKPTFRLSGGQIQLADGMIPERVIPANTILRGLDPMNTFFLVDYVHKLDKCIEYKEPVNGISVLSPVVKNNIITNWSYSSAMPTEFLRDPKPVSVKLLENFGWIITGNPDGSFSMKSKIYNKELKIVRDPATGQYVLTFADNPDASATKFLLYKTCNSNNSQVSIYHPASKTFITRVDNPNYRNALSATPGYTPPPNNSLQLTLTPARIPFDYNFERALSSWNFVCFNNGEWAATRFNFSPPTYTGDADADGHKSLAAGGDDCDDRDVNRFPGHAEIADTTGHDEDCDCETFGGVDNDRDGFFDSRYFNICGNGTIRAGNDCDDRNAAIIPGAMIYISETRVDVCGRGICDVETGYRAIKQPNGTAIVMPR